MVADFKHGPPRRFAKQFLASVLPRAVRLRRRTDAPRDRRAAVTAPATDAHVDLPAAPGIVRGDEPAGCLVSQNVVRPQRRQTLSENFQKVLAIMIDAVHCHGR